MLAKDMADEDQARIDDARRAVERVGPKVKYVREHLFGGFTSAGPTS